MREIQKHAGPHLRAPRTTRGLMLDVAIALVPALLGAIYFFGIRSLYMTAFSVAVCVLTEFLWQKLTKKPVTAGDFSAVVTGML
ncbi:MAG TPA: RnfABCDGE type electron transport complex subunit D, partial [Candidatus Pullilachnospira intestinigallinarum]|nr:RnfABCDGE type electron transport complex subunit D [Candidatus Pullilachnospira intestinigallinarum]